MSTHDDASMVEDEVQADGTEDFWPSDVDVRQANEDYYEEETYRRIRRMGQGHSSQELFDLFMAFSQKVIAPRAQGVTVPTLTGRRTLYEAFSEIARCCEHFGTHPMYPLDDTGIAQLFHESFRDRLCYIPERRQWFQFKGGRWCPGGSEAMECCKDLMQLLAQYASTDELYGRSEIGRRMTTLTNKWLTRRGRETILRDAASIEPVSMSKFDTYSNLLNCLNGTLDLNTRKFREHRASDYLTKIAHVRYDAKARCPLWEAHIDTVTRHDESLAVYLQEALGYSLTGYTRHECFFILFGPTSRNGKGVTVETFRTLLGDYAMSASPDTITRRQTVNGSGPSEDLARLAGARFVSIAESDQDMVLSSALIKTLTGNDTIAARFLHQNTFEYRPSYKIFIHTNYLPAVTDATVFRSGRVKVIPFRHHIERRDETLKEKLTQPDSLSGILNWCLDGWERLNSDEHFIECGAVEAEIEAYERASGFEPDGGRADTEASGERDGAKAVPDREPDTVGRFVREALDERPGGEVPVRTAYEAYFAWCEGHDLAAEPFRSFRNELLSRDCVVKKKRPVDKSVGQNACSMLLGYVLREKFQYLPPCGRLC